MENKRYKTDTFHAQSLEDNPLDSPSERDLHIYLPPGYYEEEEKKYPVIYFLHGYSGNNHGWTITYKNSKYRSIPWDIIPKKILKEIDIDRLTTFGKLDNQITSGDLKPFILVQPDASLHEPNIDGRRGLTGEVMTKGSFYVNSPYTGDYMDYIVEDVVKYIDYKYRTISESKNRALMGGSMGGYGTIYIMCHHPERFNVSVALSPGNLGELEHLDWELRIPIYEKIVGEKMGKSIGDSAWKDILDSLDLIFSDENRLIPSIERAEDGTIKDYDQKAYENWQEYELNNVIQAHPDALKEANLLINCHKDDEFALTEASEGLHKTMEKLNIDHKFELYNDPKAALTPHILGIGYHILPGIIYCLNYFER